MSPTVGYEQKLAASMTVEFPFTAELNDTNSQEFQILSAHLENWVSVLPAAIKIISSYPLLPHLPVQVLNEIEFFFLCL